MDKRYRGPKLTAHLINERIRELNYQLHAISQWREFASNTQWAVLVKDNICVDGLRTTAGSYALKALKAKDATCIRNLRIAGATPFGKTTMSELAGFVSTQLPPGYSELGGQGVNPIDPCLSPGGSSSGSAIAVAAGLCHAAVGTETHGSIMIPAMACGVVGIKPSVGLISRHGIIPISHSLDTPGALACNLKEAARLIEAMRGEDLNDEATLECPIEHLDSIQSQDNVPLRIALLTGTPYVLDSQAKAVLQHFIDKAKSKRIEFVEVPYSEVKTHYKMISSVEIQNDFDRFLSQFGNGNTPSTFKELVRFYEMRLPQHPFGIDRLVDALKFNPDINNSDYRQALQESTTNCTEAIRKVLNEQHVDAIATTSFVPWWAIGRAPSIALPIGETDNHRPVSLMIGQERHQDAHLLEIALRLENAANYELR